MFEIEGVKEDVEREEIRIGEEKLKIKKRFIKRIDE